MTVVVPLLIGIAYVGVMSFIRDGARRRAVNAIMVAGAGAAYLSSGAFGFGELIPVVVITFCAYRGLKDWRWIGVAWLLHTCLDIAHAVKGANILPFAPHSSQGCAICDPVIALWCLGGGRPIDLLAAAVRHRVTRVRRTRRGGAATTAAGR